MVLSLFTDINYAVKKPEISITYWNSRNYEAALTYHSEDDERDFLAAVFTITQLDFFGFPCYNIIVGWNERLK